MIIVLATTFYVRTIKSKLDTKVDAMFQLVQSLVNEVNQLKTGQSNVSKPKEVIELDINSSNKQETYSESSDNETSDSESSDNESDDDNDSPHEVNTHNNISVKPVEIKVESVEVKVEPVEVKVEPVEVEVEPVEVEVEVEPVEVKVEPVEVEDTVSTTEQVKKVVIEPEEQNYESFTVKELKELVTAKGGKITGKKKSELIEFLLS
tara:strand:+ start:142 stop:762 length:621 start_codon:yes stop_codon:yes gene_type:complete